MKKTTLKYLLILISLLPWAVLYALLSFMGKNHWSVCALLFSACIATLFIFNRKYQKKQKRKIIPYVINQTQYMSTNSVTLDSGDGIELQQYAEYFEPEILRAKESIIIVSDNLNSKLYCLERIIKAVEERVDHGVKVYILCGKFILNSGNHAFINHFMADKYKDSVFFYKRLNRPPALHYKIIDKKRLVIETIHKIGTPERTLFTFEDKGIVQMFLNKFDFCIGQDNSQKISNIDHYKFVEEFPVGYRRNYEKTLEKIASF